MGLPLLELSVLHSVHRGFLYLTQFPEGFVET